MSTSNSLPTTGSPNGTMTDDLKLISGIGPVIESHLHAAEIRTYIQLATLTSSEIADLLSDLAGISPTRIDKQKWIEQASKLASESTDPDTNSFLEVDENHQKYATFTVELLLDRDCNVRRTRILHVQKREKVKWAGWDTDRLETFIFQSASLRSGDVQTAPAGEGADIPLHLDGLLNLQDLEAVLPGSETPRHLIPQNQPFDLNLTLDMRELTAPENGPLQCRVVIYAKDLSGGPRQTVGRAKEHIKIDETHTLAMSSLSLAPGIYRLEADVTLTRKGDEASLNAISKGGLIQIY